VGGAVRVWFRCRGRLNTDFTDKTDQEQATAKAKCRGLSTARQTMRLSVTSVEMTILVVG
jgi:hypothetical protein